MKSRALFGRKGLDLEIRELELPEIGEHDVLLKVHACGVCGTDLNFIRDYEGDYQSLGHEISAEVLETGKAVKNVKAGMNAIVEDCTMCGCCPDCKAGHPEFCRNMYTLNGQPGMSEYLVVHENSLVPFEKLDHLSAALTEPLAVAYNAVQTADLFPGCSVAVMGPGPIGLLCADMCRISGAGNVAVIGRKPRNVMGEARKQLAESAGYEFFAASGNELKEQVLSLYSAGFDRVIVTAPPRAVNDALQIIRYGGKIILLGLSFKPGESVIGFDVNHAVFNKISLIPSFAEPALNFPAALALIARKKIDVTRYMTHTCGFSGCRELFASALNGDKPVIKPVFCPWQ